MYRLILRRMPSTQPTSRIFTNFTSLHKKDQCKTRYTMLAMSLAAKPGRAESDSSIIKLKPMAASLEIALKAEFRARNSV